MRYNKVIIVVCLLIISLTAKAQSLIGGHEYVDLALPSGTLWAKCNIGANKDTDTGSFFSWGETIIKQKNKFTRSNYKYYKAHEYFYQIKKVKYLITKYNNNKDYGIIDNKYVLDARDDAATSQWGDTWCMPSDDQLEELCKECKFNSFANNGKWYCKFTGKNGKVLILPIPGYYSESFNRGPVPYNNNGKVNTSVFMGDEYAFYWSKNLSKRDIGCGVALRLSCNGTSQTFTTRHNGASVRAVVSKKGMDIIQKNTPDSYLSYAKMGETFSKDDLFPFDYRSFYVIYPSEKPNQLLSELYNRMISRFPKLKATPNMSLQLLERDSEKTLPLFLMGYCEFMGLGTKVDKESCRLLLYEAAQKGDYRSTVMLFALGLASEKNANDLKLLNQASNAGYLPAKVICAYLQSTKQYDRYMDPYRLNTNYRTEKVIDLEKYNYPEAHYIYGKINNRFDCVENAAKLGHPYSFYELAIKFDNEHMYEKALDFAQKAIKHGYTFDSKLLRRIRINGRAMSHNPKEVAMAMEEARQIRAYDIVISIYKEAQNRQVMNTDIKMLFSIARKEKGVKDKNEEKEIFNLLKDGADEGNLLGMEAVADCYEKGVGIDKIDMNNAFFWYRKAAQAGSEKAKAYLERRNLKW